MRIKSYFAPSVQSAIAKARREFGDDVTLVTSHVAALDARHLGEYEVVFAIDEEEPGPQPVEPPQTSAAPLSAEPKFTAFQEVLLDAVTKKPPLPSVLDQIESVRSTLIQLAIEPAMVRALMTLVERSIDACILPQPQDNTGAVLSELADSLTASVPAEPALTVETALEPAAAFNEPLDLALAAAANAPSPLPRALNPEPGAALTPAELAFVVSVSEGPASVRR